MPIVRFPTALLIDRAWMLRHHVTAYDAMYVSLAAAVGTRLVTADEHLSPPRRAGTPASRSSRSRRRRPQTGAVHDAVVRGGRVVTADGVRECDVGIRDGAIVELSARGGCVDAAETIDARGAFVVPGGIDPHVHSDFTVRHEGAEDAVAAGPEHISGAAVLGGTTTLLDFAIWTPGEDVEATLDRATSRWSRSHTDFSHHALLRGPLPARTLDQVREIVEGGWPSLKIFTSNIRPLRNGSRLVRPTGPTQLRVEPSDARELLRRIASAGGILAVHAEHEDTVMKGHERAAAEGRTGIDALADVHGTTSEERAIRETIALARDAGAAMYLVHVSAASGVAAIAEARAEGRPVYGETLHHYLTFTRDVYARPDGALFHTYPSIKAASDRERLWRGLVEGSIGVVATDEVSLPRDVKVGGRTVFDAVGGHAGLETRLAVLYTEGVVKRGLSLERFVALASTNAARILGLHPRKGTIAVGADADLVVLDPAAARVLRAADLHDTDYSIWDGYEAAAWPTVVMLRGRVVARDGRLVAPPLGARIPRRIDPAVLAGPAVA